MTDVNQGWDAAVNLDASLLTTMAKNFSAGAEDPTIPLKNGSVTLGLTELALTLDPKAGEVVFSAPCTGTVARQDVDGTLSIGIKLASLAMGCVYPASYLATNGAADCRALAGGTWTLDSQALTLEAWVRGLSTAPWTLVSLPAEGFVLSVEDGLPVVTWGGQRYPAPGTAAVLDDGLWHFVAVSVAAQVITFYVDGQSKGTATLSSRQKTSGKDLSFGQGSQGDLTQVRLWNVARTAAQLQQAMNVTLPLPQPGLLGVWTFESSQVVNAVNKTQGSLQGGAMSVTASKSTSEDDANAHNFLWFLDPENTFTVTMSPPSSVSSLIESATLSLLQSSVTQGKSLSVTAAPPRLPTTAVFSVTDSNDPDCILLLMNGHTPPPSWPAPVPFPTAPAFTTSAQQNAAILIDDAYLLEQMLPNIADKMDIPESDLHVTGSPPVLSLIKPTDASLNGSTLHLTSLTFSVTNRGIAMSMKGTAHHMKVSVSGTLTLTVKANKEGVQEPYYDIANPKVSITPDTSDPVVQTFEALMGSGLPIIAMLAGVIAGIYMAVMYFIQNKAQSTLADLQDFIDLKGTGQTFALQKILFDSGVYFYGQLTPGGSGAQRGASSSVKRAAAPVVTDFNPKGGAPGTMVTITGTGLAGASSVSFNQTPADYFRTWSDKQLVARVAEGTTSGPIQVSTAAGSAVSTQSFSVAQAPNLTDVYPPSAQLGEDVKLSGTGLLSTQAIYFSEDILASFSPVSDVLLIVTVPGGAISGPITVVTPSGTATQEGFTVQGSQVPSISAFTPTSGAEGTEVTVTGSGFTGATAVTFGGVPASGFNVLDDGQLTAELGLRTPSGPVRVTNSRGTGISNAAFNVLPAPRIDGVSPSHGKPGTEVTITGSGLSGTTVVLIGTPSVEVPFTVVGDTKLTATSPSGTTSGPVSVQSPSGMAHSSEDFTVLSVTAPAVTDVSPLTGGRGTAVTLTGTGFTGTTGVKFGGVSAGVFEVTSDTQLLAYVPNSARSGTVSVTNTVDTRDSSQTFTCVAAPTVTQLSPTTGKAGTQVTLSGTNLTGATSVRFGTHSTAEALITLQGSTRLTTTVPPGAVSGNILVTTPGGTTASRSAFTVSTSTKPTVASFSPDSGGAGTQVTVTGKGFTGTTGVSFGATPARTYEVHSDTELVAVVDTGTKTGPLSVTNDAGTGSSSMAFTVPHAVWIDSFSPARGGVGTQVCIRGGGFTDAQRVSFGDSAMPASYTVQSDTQLTAEVPSGAIQGPLQVVTAQGGARSTQRFSVDSSVQPTVTRITPMSGPTGTQVTVEGSGFTGTTGVFMYGGTPVDRYQVVSDTQLGFHVPQDAQSGPITVANSLGTTPPDPNSTFEVTPAANSTPQAVAS
ncbi:IPT/TIG domain-containing protein [Myxococcus sp. CA040A]|uniref:IPT/TIG domain-containing protein n=1 Tax=Myxococcus sp. CA040A TaxID=2741738 RepID=UPI00157A9AF6|nr:IPT/TIG domain-containing protein [Myxococcus sp. CA040A]NTX07667.1 hypothetical protein [Myxococcus sp. CA040A]